MDMQSILARYEELLISIVSQVEVLGFNFPSAAQKQPLALCWPRPRYFHLRIGSPYAIAYRKIKKIKFPDAAIPATARAAGADLLPQTWPTSGASTRPCGCWQLRNCSYRPRRISWRRMGILSTVVKRSAGGRGGRWCVSRRRLCRGGTTAKFIERLV
ncbi:MAG: hypothetical protein WKG07_21785 [Hymenobacter sp.]